MTARIEIGRLAAKDLGKWIEVYEYAGVLDQVEHYRSAFEGPVTMISLGDADGAFHESYPSDTLIEVTGTNSKEQA